MRPEIPDFTSNQWRFLAALEACGEVIPLDAARIMAPLRPDSLEDLIKRCDRLGWIIRTEDNQIGMTADLPDTVRYDLKLMNTPEHLTALIDRVRATGSPQGLSKRAMIKLLSDAGKINEAADIEMDLAHASLEQRNHEQAYQHLSRAVGRWHSYIMGGGGDTDRTSAL